MRKRIFTSLLTIVFVFSMFTTSFANENVENGVNDVVVTDETIITTDEDSIEKNTEEVIDDYISDEVFKDELNEGDNVQVHTIPILRNKEDSFNNQAVSLMSLNDVSLMSADVNPVITGALSENFYADSTTFEIELYVENMTDTRQKLKLAVVDENDVVIAQQTGVYYQQNGLIYQMELIKSVNANTDYYIQFSYNGKYELEYEIYDASIYPVTNVAIKDVEIIDRATNSFRLALANVTVGTSYTVMYTESWNGSLIIKNATVTSDKSIFVEFGNTIPYSIWNYIYLCPLGSTSRYDQIDDVSLYYFDSNDYYGSDEGISNNGVDCNEYISTSDSRTWFYMYEKGFAHQRYEASDVSNVNVYMFDMTAGKTVGTMTDVKYQSENNLIDGYVTFNTKLDETHKYIMVFNDGYSLRVNDSFVITSEPKLTDITPYNSSMEYLQAIPAGTTFYVYAGSYNISDRNNIKVELIDASGKTIATSNYESKSHYHLMTSTIPLTAGEYTLKATYGSLTLSKPITVVDESLMAWQYVFDETVFNGKTYIGAALQTTTLNPANLTYKVVLADGTEKNATYHRSLFTEGDEKYFVVVVNEELSGISYENKAMLKMYNGSALISPTYDNNVSISSVGKTTEPFIYNEYKVTDTSVELFLEGFTNVGTLTMCGYDELTKSGVSINASKSSKTSITFNKSDLKKINAVYSLASGYGGYSGTELYIENNGEYLTYIWSSPYDGLINAVLDDKLFGYVDGSYDLQSDNTYKLNLSEGGISTKLAFGQDVTRQTFITTPAGPVPTYWTAGLEFENAVTVPLVGENGKLTIPDSVNNEFEMTIKGGGGVGIADLATCGASGEGKLAITCTIPISKDTLEAIVSGKINLFDFKLGVIEGNLFSINSPELMIYPDFGVLSANELMLASEPQQLTRAYADEELVFNVESVQLMSLGDEETSITNSTVAANTYTFSKPQIIELSDGSLLLVWIEDERSRESDADRTAIYYSYCTDGRWLEPQIIDDDTTADFNPKLKKINDTIYLTWANATANFEADESDTSKIAKTLVTSVAKWNGTGFDLMETLNNQGAIVSDITEVEGVPTIVWTENTTGDLNQTEKNIVLKSAQLIDEEWTINELLNNQAAIDGICAVENSDSLYVYYSQDTDDVTTITDKEIFVLNGGNVAQITDDETADTKPVVVNDVLYWYSGSKIAYKDIGSDDVSYVDAGCLSDNFNVSDNGSEKSIVFGSYNDSGEQTIVAICNDGEGWGKPIEVFASSNLIGGYNSAYCSDGLLRIVSNEILLQNNAFSEAAIKLYEVSDFYDIAVDNLIYDEYSANSDELWLYCDVTNNGTSTVNELRIDIYDEDDSLITISYEDVLLLPGETYTLSTACYGHEGEKVKVKVTPYPWSVEDSNLADNTAEIPVYKSDISVEKMSIENADEKTIISGYVFNRGVEDVSDVNIYLRKGASTGEIIETATATTIKPGEFEYVEFELINATDGLYYMTCDEIENENLIGNNTNFLRYSEAALVVKGDILSDGVINSKDAVKLAQYLAKWDITLTTGEQQAADVVADGVINSKDAVKLAQYLAKWDITLD